MANSAEEVPGRGSHALTRTENGEYILWIVTVSVVVNLPPFHNVPDPDTHRSGGPNEEGTPEGDEMKTRRDCAETWPPAPSSGVTPQ